MSNKLIQNIFRSHLNYLNNTPQPLKNRKAISSIVRCRTPEMGVSYYSCSENHEVIEQFHSCRHRSCYQCAQIKRVEWIESQKKRLLNTPHFHVVFTLPHEYLSLWRFNEALFTQIIFAASQKTLLELVSDKKYGGFTPGILMALHTWGRSLILHPHTHCLVSAGGLDSCGEWRDAGEFLLPSGVIRRVYRGKLQLMLKDAFNSGELVLPSDMSSSDFWFTYRSLYKKDWCVRIEERYEHGKGVLLYLARYCKGGPLHPEQIRSCTSELIEMSYLDHRRKQMTTQHLRPKDFLQRLLEHVPVGGVHTVRYYGLYSTASKARHVNCIALKGNLESVRPSIGQQIETMVLYCRTCGEVARLSYRKWLWASKGNSIYRAVRRDCAGGYVQQGVQADNANVPLGLSP